MNTANPNPTTSPQSTATTGSTPVQAGPVNPGQSNKTEQQGTRHNQGQSTHQGFTPHAAGSQENASRSFRTGSETSPGTEKESARAQDGSRLSNTQHMERCLDAIETNCRQLRQALSAGGSSDVSRSEGSDTTRDQARMPTSRIAANEPSRGASAD